MLWRGCSEINSVKADGEFSCAGHELISICTSMLRTLMQLAVVAASVHQSHRRLNEQ